MIKAIVFDWDGVFTSKVYDKILKVCDDKKKLLIIESKYFDKKNCTGFWRELRIKFKISNSDKDLEKRFNYQIETGVFDLLPKLNNYKLYLLSNQIKARTNYIKSKFKLSSFTKTFFSNEINLKKPNPDIFKFLLKKIKLSPKECIFIDDCEKNISTAKGVGMNVVKFKNLRQLKKELASFSIDINSRQF